jgi:hypothetical protein
MFRSVGKRQRDTGLSHLTDAQVQAMARDASIPRKSRRRAQREEKYRGLRNKRRRNAP